MRTWDPFRQRWQEENFINVPICLSEGNTATISLPWFVPKTEHRPKRATFAPLVNGEQAFAAVYDAIEAACHTVDIICWGFQPSMYFKRGANGHGSLSIGALLEQKGLQGVKVRLLTWGDSLHVAQFGENSRPGDTVISYKSDTRDTPQRIFDSVWFDRVLSNNVTAVPAPSIPTGPGYAKQLAKIAAKEIYRQASKRYHPPFKNIEYATRDFDFIDRLEIGWRTIINADKGRGIATKAQNLMAMTLEPSHHQKMVLVDYEHPKIAVGFVMGHNTLDEYWDTDRHSAIQHAPQAGRNGNGPRHDISSRLTGPILQDLNHNFCQAWDKATGQTLEKERRPAAQAWDDAEQQAMPAAAASPCVIDPKAMAQILRTQSQTGDTGVRDIEKVYMNAANNAHNFIYIENQYFRFQPLADCITHLVKAYENGGSTKPLYLFVITNSSDEGMGDGTLNTYRMLEKLGRPELMQGVAKVQRDQGLERELALASKETYEAQQIVRGMETIYPRSYEQTQKISKAKERLQRAKKAEQDIKQRNEDQKNQPVVRPPDIPGLKVHICTLVAPDSPSGQKWKDVYIHAKLMVVDDVFMTLGSANLNIRSMTVDSELNVCHENGTITQPLREKLWGIHTKGMGVGKKDKWGILEAEEAFLQWELILVENKKRQLAQNQSKPPYASLIEFRRDNPSVTRLD